MVYDDRNDMWFKDFHDLIEDFGFETGPYAHDSYVKPNTIPVEVVRKLSHRLDDELPGFYDGAGPDGFYKESDYQSRHIIAIGKGTLSAKWAYQNGKLYYPNAKLVAKMEVDGYTFYVGGVPKSA